MGAYDEADVRIVALSSDDEAPARAMKEEQGLGFPVLYGLDVDDMEERLGLYVNRGARVHLQPAQFLLKPDGTVALACYSSGPVGRLTGAEALGRVAIAQKG